MTQVYLSKKEIPAKQRLILALDVDNREKALELVKTLGDSVVFYKLGLQLFMSDGYFKFIDDLKKMGKEVFVDLKFFDVPETVQSAVRQLRHRNITFATVHGNDDILRAAVAEKHDVKILAVTVLTSLDNHDMQALGFEKPIEEVVLSRAERALALNCDGVISSGIEAPRLREKLGHKLLVVVPGVRPGANKDDHKRSVSAEEAFQNGADYIVVGRPIRNAPDPKKAAEEYQAVIRSIFVK